jgi:hypothetical protein
MQAPIPLRFELLYEVPGYIPLITILSATGLTLFIRSALRWFRCHAIPFMLTTRLRATKKNRSLRERLQLVHFAMAGWNEEVAPHDRRTWRNAQGDVMSFTFIPVSSFRLPDASDITALQNWSRAIAQSRGGGLIEAGVVSGKSSGVTLIYKRLEMPAYVFTGQLFIPQGETYQVWIVVAGETGTTGIREASVATHLYNTGQWTSPQEYERSWRDPYDPNYRGVDVSTLHFESDAERYDEQFPEHPLSRLRRILAMLPDATKFDSSAKSL